MYKLKPNSMGYLVWIIKFTYLHTLLDHSFKCLGTLVLTEIPVFYSAMVILNEL